MSAKYSPEIQHSQNCCLKGKSLSRTIGLHPFEEHNLTILCFYSDIKHHFKKRESKSAYCYACVKDREQIFCKTSKG